MEHSHKLFLKLFGWALTPEEVKLKLELCQIDSTC
jgi:hypothetical protein